MSDDAAAMSREVILRGLGAMKEELAELQQRVVMIDLLAKQFGDDALPVSKTYRGREVYTPESDGRSRERSYCMDRIARLTPMVRQLEADVSAANTAERQEWAKAVAAQLKRGKR